MHTVHNTQLHHYHILTEYALVNAPVNPAHAVNEAYTSNEMDNVMDSAKVAVNQDVRLTENIY